MALIKNYCRSFTAATAIEYALIAAGVSIAISAIVFLTGADLRTLFDGMQTDLAAAVARI